MNDSKYVGKPIDGLALADRWALAGKWVALELYSPERLPLRIIRAVGPDARTCIGQIKKEGADPALFEYVALEQPYSR
jgi:hypothetical protein